MVMLFTLVMTNLYCAVKWYRAEVCNRAFWLYFYYNSGIVLDMDKFYQDAEKWVHDPQYQPNE